MDFSLTREATPVVQEATETAAVSQEGSEDTQEPLSTHEATPPRQTEPLETIQQSTPSSSLLVAATPDREVTPQPRLDTLETMSVAPETDKNVLRYHKIRSPSAEEQQLLLFQRDVGKARHYLRFSNPKALLQVKYP
ncbi:hypothetical protein B9Z55_021511 [Caenorhabditis nigoni]|uniref:Uncharacterized protein n=1 Tax=Caenorhabditis nigoni TaxID=1611254 RepID=A0A2G5TS86_9PELO|nr:hypothetical protein B9Z55_021511 [Caenorhabditis nigoni]